MKTYCLPATLTGTAGQRLDFRLHRQPPVVSGNWRSWLLLCFSFGCLVYSVLLCKGYGAVQESADVGRVAIYKDDIPASGAPSSPDYLARALEAAAFSTAFLNSDQLADARSLNRERFDILVLPYGASFPVKAADNFRQFLRDGGKFFSTGGYAFDDLLERTATGWHSPSPPPPPESDHVAWHCAIPAAQLRGKGRLTFAGFLRSANVAGPGMAYLAVYQLAADG